MASISVEYINPFISGSSTVLKQLGGIEFKLGKPFIRDSSYSGGDVAILIGITGDIKGQVIITIGLEAAKQIASNMMGGMPINELDEISKSALAEMGNMILGNVATIFSNNNKIIDITPPSLIISSNLQISTQKISTICIPLTLSIGGVMEIEVALSEK